MIHVYTHMGKLHCVNATGTVVLGPETFYFDCSEQDLRCIECGQPCCISFSNNGIETVLTDCTLHGKTIRYKEKRTLGRSDK